FEIQKYVPLQATPKRINVIRNTLTDSFPLMLLINSISHPSNGFYIIGIQLFSYIFYVAVYNAIFHKCVVIPKPIKKHLSGKDFPLIFQHKPEQRKFFAGQNDFAAFVI